MSVKTFQHIAIFSILTLSVIALAPSCGGGGGMYADEMDAAESLMESRPDSAMKILNGIDREMLKSDRGKARYALLMSMALDKNYVDTTNFDVLQPAIDYYLRKGNSDERLRTLYYQGRIYQNAGDYEKAMDAYIDGRDLMPEATDTLTMARLLTAQGVLFHKQYKYKEFVENSLLGASLFGKKKMPEYEFINFIKALGGAIMINERTRADSIICKCDSLLNIFPNAKSKYLLNEREIVYHITFDDSEELSSFLDIHENLYATKDNYLNLSYAYLKLNEGDKAYEYLNKVTPDDYADTPLKYLSIKAQVLESVKDYEKSLGAYKEYVLARESKDKKLMSDSLLFAEHRHEMEMKTSEALRKKDRVIMVWSVSVFLLIMISVLLFNIYRHNKIAAHLRAENMQLRINELEEERNDLKDILKRNELTDTMREVVKERLEMLNARLSKDITYGAGESAVYDRWINTIRNDSEKFMQSNQIAFRVSHPGFIRHLEEHGLSDFEISYVCLYALGMLGKEVGEFTKLKGHYNLSTAIRKKLGIEENATALKVYVKNLLAKG